MAVSSGTNSVSNTALQVLLSQYTINVITKSVDWLSKLCWQLSPLPQPDPNNDGYCLHGNTQDRTLGSATVQQLDSLEFCASLLNL